MEFRISVNRLIVSMTPLVVIQTILANGKVMAPVIKLILSLFISPLDAMMMPQSNKDARLLEQAKLDKVARKLLAILKENPFQYPPAYKNLQGDLKGCYSRRINKQHRIIYDVLPNDENLKDENGIPCKGIVKIIRMWTHYE